MKNKAAIIRVQFCLMIFSCFNTKAEDCQPRIIFEEKFDNIPDWVSRSGQTIPANWSEVRAQKRWSPDTGHSDRHHGQEILSSNNDKSRGNNGKSWVKWRESYNPGWNEWNSDNMLAKIFDTQHSDLLISFYIKFSPGWKGFDTSSKMFRVFFWNGDKTKLWSGFNGGLGPMLLWNYGYNNYGLRNFIGIRGGPAGYNYAFKQGDIKGLPRQIGGLGDMSLNFTSDTKSLNNDNTDPVLISQITGKPIPKDNYVVKHEDIYGHETGWAKVEFYLKMNSALDVEDGILMQWVNGTLVFNNKSIPWNRSNQENLQKVGWNGFAIGGNDFFNTVPNNDRYEEWYSIDDITVSTSIPEWFIKLKSENRTAIFSKE